MERPKQSPDLFDWFTNEEDDLDTANPSLEVTPEDLSPLQEVQAELAEFPTDPDVLLKAALMALLEERPELSLRYQHRFSKRYMPLAAEDKLLRAIALAQQGRWPQAALIVKQEGAHSLLTSVWALPLHQARLGWFRRWLTRIESEQQKRERQFRIQKTQPREERPRVKQTRSTSKQIDRPADTAVSGSLPTFEFAIPVSLNFPEGLESFSIPDADGALSDFWLQYEFTHLELLQVFDELMCLSHLRDVDIYSHQIEAVRKVLKQFRGRVLLADEVGLGKTIEAGIVLKEYLLRGMVERVLILTPASLVNQWQEEMAVKFGISFASSYESLLRRDAAAFWAQPRVIASIATARRPEHSAQLASQRYDLVIVDEAHHLKNRSTANWKLVNALQKRFLLLLSATPVQNNLLELYNLVTLLKPGVFKTEKEFRTSFMTSGNPRLPANCERLRDLMREVMIRSTRSLVDVHLPPRHATTILLDASHPETSCYDELTRLVQDAHQAGPTQRRLALRHLLSAAGSSPATAADSIGRVAAANDAGANWLDLRRRYELLGPGSKQLSLCELIRKNPEEKKAVFVHHRATLAALKRLMTAEGLEFSVFEGGMSGPDKDRAVKRFRDEVPLLLCTESGGEGRNLQFCNTIINFDLPWNPMAIEQRIGRVHRIGQKREVFIFNLVVRHTLEEQILRVLDEKINMFELVVGEIGDILGQLGEEIEFAELVFAAWMETTESERHGAFDKIGQRLAAAKSQYDLVKSLDADLFGEDFAAG